MVPTHAVGCAAVEEPKAEGLASFVLNNKQASPLQPGSDQLYGSDVVVM